MTKREIDQRYPPGWDEERVRRLAESDDHQSEDEALAEHEGALALPNQTLIQVPTEILLAVRELIAETEREHPTGK
jgi:hypothetical protein